MYSPLVISSTHLTWILFRSSWKPPQKGHEFYHNSHVTQEFFVLFCETESHYATQIGLELMIFLSQFPKCWDYRCVPLCMAYILLSDEKTEV
jgi:hypothetical protein